MPLRAGGRIPTSLRGAGPYGPYGPEAAFISFRLSLASCKQGFDLTHDLLIFVKAQSNGFPWADTGANTASVAKGLIDFNETYR